MSIFGVSIIYNADETLRLKEDWKVQLTPKKIRKLRVYDVTTEADRFRKYRIAVGFWGVLLVHIKSVFRYWFIIRSRMV